MSPFGGGIDVFEVDFLESNTFGVDEERFSEGKQPLPGSNNVSLDHEEIFVDLTVVTETSHWCDGLVSKIESGGGTVGISLNSNTVNLLVDFSPVMVSVLTSSWYRETHSRWMPSSNTGDLPQTFVSLPGQFLGSPSEGYTVVSVTSGDSNNIDQLVLSEEIFDADGLL